MEEMIQIREKIRDAQKLLIGIGKEFSVSVEEIPPEILEAYEVIRKLTEGKDYYVLTSNQDKAAVSCGLPEDRLAFPAGEGGEKNWDAYNEWLSRTLNHRLVILELGEGFLNPAFMRWPFEKVAYINQQAFLIRVNEKFPQTAAELAGKSLSVRENSVSWIRKMSEREGSL